MTCTVSALHAIGQRNAVLLHPHRMTDLYGRLVRRRNLQNGSRRTHLRTLHTLGSAVPPLVGDFGLHQYGPSGRRPQYARRTHRHTELTPRTVSRHIPQALCSGRYDRRRTVRNLFIQNHGQPSIDFLLLCPNRSRRRQKTHTREEHPTARYRLFRYRSNKTRSLLNPASQRSASVSVDS